jgi:hypothetical protein
MVFILLLSQGEKVESYDAKCFDHRYRKNRDSLLSQQIVTQRGLTSGLSSFLYSCIQNYSLFLFLGSVIIHC